MFNPQNLNRYSYVLNNPQRYTDPTGHRVCEEYAGTCLSENQVTQISNNHNDADGPGGGNPHDKDGDGIPDIPDSDLGPVALSNDFTLLCPNTQTAVECFYMRHPFDLIDGPLDISMEDLQNLLLAVFFDVKARKTSGIHYYERGFYDTPFWNGYGLLPGDVCVDETCYKRQEVNYVAQGMWAANAGQSIEQSRHTVEVWKNLVYGEDPSLATYFWNDVGYNTYTALNPYYAELSVIYR